MLLNAAYLDQSGREFQKIIPTVKCTTGHEFCLGCGSNESHEPAPCKQVKVLFKVDDPKNSYFILVKVMAKKNECRNLYVRSNNAFTLLRSTL